MAARKNILKLARKISGPVAMLIDLDENAPEYKVLNCVVTDEMAEVALAMELRGPCRWRPSQSGAKSRWRKPDGWWISWPKPACASSIPKTGWICLNCRCSCPA